MTSYPQLEVDSFLSLSAHKMTTSFVLPTLYNLIYSRTVHHFVSSITTVRNALVSLSLTKQTHYYLSSFRVSSLLPYVMRFLNFSNQVELIKGLVNSKENLSKKNRNVIVFFSVLITSLPFFFSGIHAECEGHMGLMVCIAVSKCKPLYLLIIGGSALSLNDQQQTLPLQRQQVFPAVTYFLLLSDSFFVFVSFNAGRILNGHWFIVFTKFYRRQSFRRLGLYIKHLSMGGVFG